MPSAASPWSRFVGGLAVVVGALLFVTDSTGADHISLPTLDEAEEQLESMLIGPDDVPELQMIPAEEAIDDEFASDLEVAARRRVFVNGEDTFIVTLWDPRPGGWDARLVAATFARPDTDDETTIDVAAIDPDALGLQWHEPEQVGTMVVRAHGGLVVTITHLAPRAPDPDDFAELLGPILRTQLDRAFVEPLAEPEPENETLRVLADLAVVEPDSGANGGEWWPVPGLSGPFDADLLAHLDVAVGQGLAGDLARFGVAWQRSFADVNGTVATVRIWDLGSSERAGTMLGVLRDGLPRVDQVEETNLFVGRWTVGTISVAIAFGRRDRFLHTAFVETALDPAVASAEVVPLAMRQRNRLPLGAEGAIARPSGAELSGQVVGRAFGAASAVFGLLAGGRLVAKRLGRRQVEIDIPDPLPDGVDDVTTVATRLRSDGSRLGLALFGGLVFIVAGLTLALTSFSPTVVWIGLGMSLVGPLAMRWLLSHRRRIERPIHAKRVGVRRRRLVRVVISSILAGGTLLLGLLIGASGIQMQIVPPSYELADLDRRVGGNLSTTVTLVGITLMLVGMVLARVARRQFRLRAAELREFDDRPPVVFLRGFQDDRLRVPSIVSGRRNAIDLLSPRPSDRFENVVSWQLDEAGPTIAVAPPGSGLGSLGPAREYATEEDWIRHVEMRIDEAGIIATSVSATGGLLREVHVATKRALERVVFLFPPVGAAELRQRWNAVRSEIVPGAPNDLPIDPAFVLCACYDEGQLVAITSDRRDEAGYRAAIDAAAKRVSLDQETVDARPVTRATTT